MEQLLGSLDSLVVKIDALPAPEDPLLEELLAFLECFHRTERNRPTTTAAQAEEFGRLVIEAGAHMLVPAAPACARRSLCAYSVPRDSSQRSALRPCDPATLLPSG